MIYRPPYQHPALDASIFRELQNAKTPHMVNPSLPPLRNIAIIGGLVKSEGELNKYDLLRLAQVVKRLNQIGMALSKDAKFFCYDLSKRDDFLHIGSDFRAACDADTFMPGKNEPSEYDLAFLSYVSSEKHDPNQQIEHAVSPNQKHTVVDGTMWARAAFNHGTRIVSTYGYEKFEVHTGHFDAPDLYRVCVPTWHVFDRRELSRGMLHGAFGYAIRTQDVDHILDHTNQDAPLAHAIQDAFELDRA